MMMPGGGNPDWTILHDCRQLIIPVINEIFGEEYTGEEAVEFHPNEHFMDRQDAADQERITDSNFTVFGREKKKYHIECESSLPDGRMTIRLFEYDAQIAQKYQRIQEEGIGDMMRGALLETEARKIKTIGEKEAKRETALRMLSAGKYALEEIADISGLTLEEVRQLGEGKSA